MQGVVNKQMDGWMNNCWMLEWIGEQMNSFAKKEICKNEQSTDQIQMKA